MKRCGHCKRCKETTEFGFNKFKKDGLCGVCKLCRKKYKINHKDKIQESQRKYYIKNKAKCNEASRKWAREIGKYKRYGITKEEYDSLIISQNNKCAICGINFSGIKKVDVHIDHDHITLKVRGIICRTCNWCLGWFDTCWESVKEYKDRA